MKSKSVKINIFPDQNVSAIIGFPEDIAALPPVIYLAHGAGNGMDSTFINYFYEYLIHHGCIVIKFNFAYMETGKKAPDTKEKLIDCYRKVIHFIQEEFSLIRHPLFLAGKSMGGRIASYLAAEGDPISGMIFLGYPLHPPGKTNQLRDKHLYRVQIPLLFLSGTRDRLAETNLLKKVVKKIPSAVLSLIPEGDHSFRVPKKLRKSDIQVWSDAGEIIVNWVFQKVT